MNSIKRGYQWVLAICGLFVLVTATLTLCLHATFELVVLSVFAVMLSLLPIYLPGGIIWGTGVIAYIFVLHQYGICSSFIPLTLGTATVFFKHYHWDVRRVKWFRFFVTLGMYMFSLVGSFAIREAMGQLPTYFHMLAMIVVFEALNLLLFLGIGWSTGQRQGVSQSFKTFHLIPLFATATILTLLIQAKYIIPSVFYACILLLCFILLSRQYFKAVASSTEAEHKYRLIARHTTDLIIVIDKDGTISYASPSHEHVFHCKSETLHGTNVYTYVEEPMRLQTSLEEIQRRKEPDRLQLTLVINQNKLMVETELSPVLGKDGQLNDIIVVSRDITERLRQQEYIVQTEKLAVTGELAAGIAHEIRNPLTAIKGFVQLLQEYFNDISSESFNVIWTEVCRIDEITSELLMLAKPQQVQYQDNDIVVLIHHTVTLLEGQAHQKNIYFEFTPCAPIHVYCNANQMRQVFLNVFKNGIEAMQHGGTIYVRLQLEQDEVVIEIVDEGSGIPEQLISKLGQPFYTTKEKGTGLGLMVVNNIVQEHRGTLNIFSRPNEGTTVQICLPLSAANCKDLSRSM